jgi:integrase/recombinase XerD
MPKTRQITPNNLSHNVPALLTRGQTSLAALARAYFAMEVAGQARGTIEAKKRDLERFLHFYHQLYGHDRPAEWYPSVTREFLKQLRKSRPAQATVVRTYASVRRFARWVHRIQPFPAGCPTDGVKPPEEPEPEWKGLSRANELRLLNAAHTLRLGPGRGSNQGLRDHAAVAVLLGTGLRVSEMLNLNREQYTGRGFAKVPRKGGHIRDFVPMQAHARTVLEEWLAASGGKKGPLFATRTGERLRRNQMGFIIQRVAAQANTHLPREERFTVSPHVLRHTFLRKLAEEKGVQYAKEASGHKSDRYIWRYVKPNQASLAEAVDSLDA